MLNKKYWKPENENTPRLFFAPMQGVSDGTFRQVYSNTIGGFDEACTDFLRVPDNAHTKSLASKYHHDELKNTPLAAQIMGNNPFLMAEMAERLEARKAPRIDINCACPSNTVNRGQAGASLLKDPEKIFNIASAVRQKIKIPLSIKIRLGYDNDALFPEILSAIESSGADFVIIHARTRSMGYRGKADWTKIKLAKELINIPVVGNGDLLAAEDIIKAHQESGCDGIMVGRGALHDPWIFHKTKAAFRNESFQPDRGISKLFLENFYLAFKDKLGNQSCINRIKSMAFYLIQKQEMLKPFLSKRDTDSEALYKELLKLWLQ